MNFKKVVPKILFYGSIVFYVIIWVEGIVGLLQMQVSSWDICRILFVAVDCKEIKEIHTLTSMLPFIMVHVIPISLIIVFYFIKRRFR